jgi:hypothetical protein
MNDLPVALRTKLNLILNRDLIDRFPVLQHMQIDAYLKVVARLAAKEGAAAHKHVNVGLHPAQNPSQPSKPKGACELGSAASRTNL